MKLRPLLLALAVLSLQAGIAVAKKEWVGVTDFNPKAGPAGTLVTITGTGFAKHVQVTFDGREVREERKDENSLSFYVPEGTYDGIIVLRAPGPHNDTVVGTFRVTGPLGEIAGFSPASGPPGTRVELTGHFMPGDEIELSGRRIEVIDRGESRVVVVIPPGARDGAFTLVRPVTGQRASARAAFNVTAGAPYVSGFSPAGGPPGTPVRVTGGNFRREDTVTYGRAPMQVEREGEDFFEVVVPLGAGASEPFVVRGPRGEARSQTEFALTPAAAITEFRPPSGAPGTRVFIHGTNFQPGDVVYLGTLPTEMHSLEPGKIVILVPPGAVTDVLTVRRQSRIIAASATAFVVAARIGPPVVSTFSPTSGPPGTQVALQGAGFTPDVRVSFDGVQLPIIGRSGDGTVTVLVPRSAARGAPFVVSTRFGETRSGAWFELRLPAVVESVTPTSGPVGTAVTIRGRGFRGDEIFMLGEQPLRTIERRGDAYAVEIPGGAASGMIGFDTAGGRVHTPFRFDVMATAVIQGFSPPGGPPRTQVLVRGDNLGGAAGASYGNLAAAILRRAPNEILIEIPPAAQGADFLFVDVGGARVRSNERFRVGYPPPAVSTFSPAAGGPGVQVVISGVGFLPSTAVWLGGQACNVVSRGPTQLVVAVPPGVAPGRVPFTVTDEAGARIVTQLPFEVLPPEDNGAGHHEHAHAHPHGDGGHHHHPHVHPHREGVNHHHPY